MRLGKTITMFMVILIVMLPISIAVQINHDPNDVVVTTNTAQIPWTTDVEADSTVNYALSQEELADAPETMSTDALVTEHSIQLSDLLGGTTYYYQLISSDGEEQATTDVHSFTTESSQEEFLTLDAMPDIVSSNLLYVTGTTRQGRIMIYANRDDDPTPDVNVVVEEGAFNESVLLDTARIENGIVGYNDVEVVAYDENGNTDSETFSILVDTLIPNLNLNALPEYTNDTSLNLSGSTEVGGSLNVKINQGNFEAVEVDEQGYFDTILNLGSQGQKNITVVARDLAGNENIQYVSTTLDTERPTFDFDTNMGPTVSVHSVIFKVKGHTEPGARVTVMNIGDFTDFETYNQYLEGEVQEQTFTIDPLGYIIGQEQETTADSTGYFEVSVNLVSSGDGGIANNHLYFRATDRAGNIGEEMRSVEFEPGCFDWVLGNINTYPYIIYSDIWHSNNIDGTAFIPLNYIGDGEPVLQADPVAAFKDGPKGDNNLLQTPSGIKSWYDNRDKTLYVSVPITISQTGMSNDEIKDTISDCGIEGAISSHCLEFYLQLEMNYNVDGNTDHCKVFPIIAYDVEIPKTLTDWLSEKFINDTIENFLKPTIDFLDKATEFISTITIWTLGLCFLSITVDFVRANSPSSGPDQHGCYPVQKHTYWICDRVLCPKVAAKCDKFVSWGAEGNNMPGNLPGTVGTWSRTLQDGTSTQIMNAYTFQQALESSDNNLRLNAQLCQARAGPDRSVSHVMEIGTTEGSTSFTSEVTQPEITGGGDGEDGEDNPVLRVQRDSVKLVTEYQCIFGDPPAEGESPSEDIIDEISSIEGLCYQERCPQMDATKCWPFKAPDEGIDPTNSLISSGRCGCLPGMYGHLRNYKTILEGTQQCLEQALIGEAMGGICERLMAIYICDLFIDALEATVFKTKAPVTSGTSRWMSPTRTAKITESLQDRYSGMLTNSRLGLSTTEVANKMCVAGFTGDWSMIEGAFQGLIESIEIPPVVHIEGESTPHAFDPFTGKMAIAYNLYLGIIPGGEMKDINFYLECDRNAPLGDMCGATIERYEVPFGRRTLEKGTNINENIFKIVEDSSWWYNKLVLEYKYKIRDEWKEAVEDIDILQRGTLAFNCDFSLVGGISCATNLIDDNGIVHIAEVGNNDDSTRFSPQVDNYYTGNWVNVIVPIENDYIKPFYLYARITDASGSVTGERFVIPAKRFPLQRSTYNLPISLVGQGAQVNENTNVGDFTLGSQVDQTGNNRIQGVQGSITAPAGPVPVDLQFFKQGQVTPAYTCTVPVEVNPEGGPTIAKTCLSSNNNPLLGNQDIIERIVATSVAPQSIALTLYIVDIPEPPQEGGTTTTTLQDSSRDPRLPETDNTDMINIQISGQEQAQRISGSWTIELQPFAEEEEGGTLIPLLYDTLPQIRTLTYRIGSSPTQAATPKVEIVEPTGDYVPRGGNFPIGINAIDPENEIDRIEITVFEGIIPQNTNIPNSACGLAIVKDSSAGVRFHPLKFSESDANGDVKSGKCTITFYESGTEDQNMELYRSDNANYQFFRFSVNPTSIPAGYDPDVPGQENLDYFIIAKVVATEDRQEDQDTKRFAFTDNNLHISEITLCQAGGMRSDTGSLFNDGGPQNSGEVTYPQGCLEFFPSQPLNSDDLVALFGE